MTGRASPLLHRRPGSPLQAFQQAVAFHDQGRLWEAERLYQAVLQADDRHFVALCRMGLLRLQQSRFDDAVRLFRRAVKVDKNSAEAHQYLGFALTGLERSEEAVRSFQKALALKPAFPEARNNFGHALQKLGRLEAAIAQFEKALAIRPDYAEARNNLGNALHLLDRSEEAIAQYEKALAIRPEYAEAHWNLGNALRAVGRPEEAIGHYEKALAIRPKYAEAHNGLGNALRMRDRSEEAIKQYEQALAINPNYFDARINLADALEALERPEEAIAHYDKALAIKPQDVQALIRRGNALERLKRLNEAIESFEKALSLDLDHAHAFSGLAGAAIAACDWARTARLAPEVAARAAKGKPFDAFTFLGYSSEPALQSACARSYFSHLVPAVPSPLSKGRIWRNQKLRIAYLATGFHQHPNAFLTAELFEIHDRSRFEVLGISLGPDDGSEMRSRLVRAFDQFHDVRKKSDREVATLISDLQVDILVDRTGYQTNARPQIVAHRPAPIQVNYLGFPGTLGTDCYDYVIADPIVLPFDQQPFYAERIVHLPECYQSNDSKRAIAAETPTREQAGLPPGFVFCCFNSNYKLTAPVFEVWMRLLRKVEGSVLWLLRRTVAAEENLRREAAARGIDPARLVFAERVKLADHLARHRLADLFLDTLPFNAHTTASDSLWAGLPLITCRGPSFQGRVAASLLHAIGLPDLVTDSLDDYETLALKLATEPSLLRGFRERLQQNRATYPLFDSDRYRRHIEAAYTTMWEIWQRGESPRRFAVEPLANGGAQA